MKICVLGANSAIALACIERWAQAGHSLYLVARNGEALKRNSQDLSVRYDRPFPSEIMDLDLLDQHEAVLARAAAALQGLDLVFMAHGALGNQTQDQTNWPAIHANLTTNFLSCASLATHAATFFEQQGHGSIAVIGSVAGDRGRPSNYIYGSGKGALAIFLA
ncbi:MAG: SDR family NAD(P)-dependent oxidoreductase, partial [Acidobacteria bacterium]|nr:SDR family NAD(P)-dependent oxidoreductase [Acidobacteriota bacterium]